MVVNTVKIDYAFRKYTLLPSLALSLSSPFRTQLLPSADFLSLQTALPIHCIGSLWSDQKTSAFVKINE